jgi:methylisocitrate lyase
VAYYRWRDADMPRESLRKLLEEEAVVFVPGAWDGLSALMIQQAGFRALCVSGFAVAASLGLPDAGLATMMESLETLRGAAAVTDIPIIADIDTGYGNAINVMRTVRVFEAAGAGAVFMEDQESPKRCPICVADPAALISKHEAVGKIRAAVDARTSELVVIARTDAIGEDAIDRACAYAEAGADMIMTMARTFSSVEEVRACQQAHGKPMMLSLTPSTWIEREFTRERLLDCNVKIALFPMQALYAAVTATRQRLAQLLESEYAPAVTQTDIRHSEFVELVGFPELVGLEETYLPASSLALTRD